jgi:hypothetical protein
VITHPACPCVTPKSSRMSGTTTFTNVWFNTETKIAETITARSRRVEILFPRPGSPALKPRPPRFLNVRFEKPSSPLLNNFAE